MNNKGKDKRIEIRLSQEEKERLQQKANKLDMTITSFIKASISNKKIVDIDRVALFKQLKLIQIELNNTGKNINQFVKLLHMLNKSDQLNGQQLNRVNPLIEDHYKIQEECLKVMREIKAFYK